MLLNVPRRCVGSFARRGVLQVSARHYATAAAAMLRENPQLHNESPPKDPRLSALKQLAKHDKDMVVFKDISVQHIIESKAGGQLATVATVNKPDTVYSAIKKMNAMRVGALVVTEDGKPVGMISERDYLNKVILRGFSSKEITVNDIMTRDIVTVTPDVTAGDCMELMTQGRFRHIPVVDANHTMIGIVSIGDLVKTILDQQKETITFLKEYIERTY